VAEVIATGFPCLAGICPEMYMEQAFVRAGLAPKNPLPVARDLGRRSILLLVHPTLSRCDMERYADAVEQVIRRAMNG
jgi:dTDP-4-amino-4,6-dideoxygalactose transaminase